MTSGRQPSDPPDPRGASSRRRKRKRGLQTRRSARQEADDKVTLDAAQLDALVEQARARRDSGSEFADVPQGSSANPRRRRPRPPAEGERNAVVGYLGQYELAAERTLVALRSGTLSAVRVADVSAGQIDDFQLESTDRVDAHQVKWSLHPGNVGFAEFARDTQDRTRYVRQLADGWQRLKAVHSDRRVVVHFVANDLPSIGTSTTIPRPDDSRRSGAARTWSFAAFLAEALQPAIGAARAGGDPSSVVPADWHPAMSELASASGLAPELWWRFLADCELEFGVPSLDATIGATLVGDRACGVA